MPHLHLAGLDLGQVENVVDEGEQLLAAGLNVAHPAMLLVGQAARRMSSTSLKPRMLLSGVRSSWLIVARKSLLRRFDS